MTLAICVPQIGAASETFIRRHVEQLAPGETVVVARRSERPAAWTTTAPTLFLDELGDSWGGPAEQAALTAFLVEHGVRSVLAEFLDIWLPFTGAFAEHAAHTVHHGHGYDVSTRLSQPYWVEAYRDLATVVVPSEAARHRLAAAGIAAEVVPSGIDVPPRPVAGGSGVLAVGRLVDKKAPLHTIAAARAAGVRLTLVGDGPLAAAAREAAGPDVELTGALPHDAVLARMCTSAIFCQHSVRGPDGDEEGLPVAILEAMAHGLPVVSTRHAGIPEAVEDGVTGFLVDEHDVAAMAARLAQLGSDPELRARMGAAAHAVAQERFGWPRARTRLRSLLGLRALVPC